MLNKQDFNREKGESRTRAVLSDNFWLDIRSVDIDGADILAELKHDSLQDLKNSYERIQVRGRIQAKYFEDANEVKIAKEYVIDEEGIRIDFFALLHTNDPIGNDITYFFTADDINKEFYLRYDNKTLKEYYIFRLTRANQFESHKNISKQEINRIIEYEKRRIEEYRAYKFNQGFISKTGRPTINLWENSNLELFKKLENKHILDKLYIALNYYNDFRRITAWRLIDKISFKHNENTSTYYNQYSLCTNNEEIIKLFENLEFGSELAIKNKSLFNSVKQYQKKINSVLRILNQNGIVRLFYINQTKEISILIPKTKCVADFDTLFDTLDFYNANKVLNEFSTLSVTNWEKLEYGFTQFKLGKYKQAKVVYSEIKEDSILNKQYVLSFIASYNLRLTAFEIWDNEYPDLNYLLNQCHLSTEKKSILNSFIEDNFLMDYSKAIDEIYFKIKEFKQRRFINNTDDLIRKLLAKLWEYQNFIEGNWLLTNRKKEFEILVEKVIEAVIISFSMRTDYSSHLLGINDFILAHAIHFCEPHNLLNYFQRNGVRSIDYNTDSNFFAQSLENLFSKANVDYLYDEIVYHNRKTRNPDLRRKVEKIFNNICVLYSYLKFENQINNIVVRANYFIQRLDFSINDLSFLAHPILNKPRVFSKKDLLKLISILLKKENPGEGYLLTNCLLGLNEIGFKFNKNTYSILNSLIEIAITNPDYPLIKVIPKLISLKKKNELSEKVISQLDKKFNSSLFYYSVISGAIKTPLLFIEEYFNSIELLLKKNHEIHFMSFPSPYTGIDQFLSVELNRFVEIIYMMDNNKLKEYEILSKVMSIHPYYNFLLSIETYNTKDKFKLDWLLENQSKIILDKISKNIKLKLAIKNIIKSTNNIEILQIYIQFFT